jgi:hypothetical protein
MLKQQYHAAPLRILILHVCTCSSAAVDSMRPCAHASLRFASFVLVWPALHASLFSVDITHRARLFKRFAPHLACCLRGSYSSLLSSGMQLDDSGTLILLDMMT